jgi:hypothetical protein
VSRLLVLIALFLPVCHGQTTQWFFITNGVTSCRGSTVVAPLPKISFFCGDATEAAAGSFTAALNTAQGVFQFGLNTTPSNGLTCMVAINATPAPITIGSFGTIPSMDAAYQCSSSGFQSGQSLQVWTGPGRTKGKK